MIELTNVALHPAAPLPGDPIPWHIGTYEEAHTPLTTPKSFGNSLSDCVPFASAFALESHKNSISKTEFIHSNAAYLHGILPEYLPLTQRAIQHPETTQFLLPTVINDENKTIACEFNPSIRRVNMKEMDYKTVTLTGIVDPTNRTDRLPTAHYDERPQIKVSLTEIDPRYVQKIQESLDQLDIATGYENGSMDPGAISGLRTFADGCKKSLEKLLISTLSFAYNVTYFNTTTHLVDTMTLGTFKLIVNPDRKIYVEIYGENNGGKTQKLLTIPPEQHDLNYDEVQSYLNALHVKLSSGTIKKSSKSKSK